MEEIGAPRRIYTTQCWECGVTFTDPKTYELHIIRHVLTDLLDLLDWMATEIVDTRNRSTQVKPSFRFRHR